MTVFINKNLDYAQHFIHGLDQKAHAIEQETSMKLEGTHLTKPKNGEIQKHVKSISVDKEIQKLKLKNEHRSH